MFLIIYYTIEMSEETDPEYYDKARVELYNEEKLTIDDLSEEIIDTILSYLDHASIKTVRLVSRL